jgi:hypothetical protein
MSTSTIDSMTTRTGVTVLDHIDPSADVPVVSVAAAQGDVSILRVTTRPATTPMPARVDVVRGEAGGNTHSLHPSGDCFWDAATARSVADLTLGTLTVPEGSTAVLAHPEHGFLELAPGTYRIGRQREYAGEWAYVAD